LRFAASALRRSIRALKAKTGRSLALKSGEMHRKQRVKSCCVNLHPLDRRENHPGS
jgi:hypothetical protein